MLTLTIGVGPAIVLASTYVNPAAYWRVGAVDLACGAVSVVALVVWLSLDDPVAAVLLAVLADLVAGVPTVRKAWTHPETENPVVFVGGGLNGLVTLATIREWTVETWAFPAYITLLGWGVATIVVLRGRRPLSPDGRDPRAPR